MKKFKIQSECLYEQKKEEYLEKFKFTSCDECVNKIDGVYQNPCGMCRHWYSDYFQKRVDNEKQSR